ncbi:phosphodiester glycosidase family protein [Patescibacteria group bacterium]|nr:MAG: phosphodiester glycosidase family protein [Patescibacteria group bacterium]
MDRVHLPLWLVGVAIALVLFPTGADAAVATGQRVKLACPTGAGPTHVCKSVYYVGGDGRRHAFPSDTVYFSWYPDFLNIQIVTAAALAAIPLGDNVTYRPGTTLVKFESVSKVYAVAGGGELRWMTSEALAAASFGSGWSSQVKDIADVLFSNYRFGADITAAADYDRAAELAAAPTIEATLESTFASRTVATARGSFDVEVVTLQKSRFAMITDTADTSECNNGCAVRLLADYATDNGATVGINGTYFCPAEYPDCAGKSNTFLSPVFNSAARVMRNASSLVVHKGPMLAAAEDGRTFFFHRTADFGSSVSAFEAAHGARLAAALANYPSLVEDGVIVVESEERLSETNPTVSGVRAAIGMNDRSFFLVVAHQATVTDLASVMQELGATNALNLDGGGSAALWYDNGYKAGPGRHVPNAILFKKK